LEASVKKTKLLLIAIGSLMFLTSALLSEAAQQTQRPVSSSSAEKENRPVIVAGAVVAPTRIILRRKARLSESLTVAGGFTKKAKGVVQLIHADGTFHTFRRKDIKGDDIKVNPYLQSGDVISVF
jgi:protein involved in polysaccharide export with SLBB domain